MSKDFATRPKAKRRKPKGKQQKAPLFHGPSFGAGSLLGAAVVVVGAAAPDWLASRDVAAQTTTNAAPPELTFEFHDILESSGVRTDPAPYDADIAELAPSTDATYLIQAAAFKKPVDAEQLRASLMLQDLPVALSRVALQDDSWYRVTVGPFDDRTEAQRSMRRLREQNLNAIWIKQR